MEVSHLSADKVAGLTTLTLGGTLQVVVNGTLNGGEVFKLFEAEAYAGDFAFYDLPTLPEPLGWDVTSVPVDGTLRVTGGAPPPPSIGSIGVSGANLIIAGSGGSSGGAYTVLTSTNVALPMNLWSTLLTSNFDSLGNFSLLTPINPARPQSFYRLQVP